MSRQLFLNALTRKNPPGTFALGSATSIACQDVMAATGTTFPQAHVDAEAMARLSIAGHTLIGLDVVAPLFSVCHEVTALGCNTNWGSPGQMPESGKPIWKSVDDIRVPADFLSRPACQVPLEAIRLLRSRLGDSAAICGKAFGPWTLSYHLFGVENFLIGTIDDPDNTKRILEKLAPVTVAFANAQFEAGADCICLADHATRDLCSPDAYHDFLQQLHDDLASRINGPAVMHICGNTSDRVGMIAKTRLAAFHWDTKSGSPAEFRKLAGERICLMGGINNLMLLNGKPEEVTAAAKQAAASGIDIIGPECAIPLKTPLANLQAIAKCRQ